MSEPFIKYVVVLDGSDTWLQMADKREDCIVRDGQHLERWHYSRHEKGDSLMFKEKAGDKSILLSFMNLPPL